MNFKFLKVLKQSLLIFSLFVLVCTKNYAQNFYETKFESKGVTYYGLLTFYDDSDASMRVYYFKDGYKNIVEFKCFGRNKTNKVQGNGTYVLDGKDARFIKMGKQGQSYNADNFIFYLEQGTYREPVVIDDYYLKFENYKQYESPVIYWRKAPVENFTESYLSFFYLKNEHEYADLLDMKSEKVNHSEKEELKISNHAFSGNNLYLVKSKGTGITEQVSKHYKSTIPDDWIKESWSDGYEITSVSYGKGDWLVTMSKNTGWGIQSYYHTATFPSDWINEKWEEGYSITSVSFGGGKWMVVMTKNTGYGLQTWFTTYEFPKDKINEKWSDHYISSTAYGNGLWAMVMTKEDGYSDQLYLTKPTFPQDWINEKKNEGFYVSTMSNSGSLWHVVVTKKLSYKDQQITYNPSKAQLSSDEINNSTVTINNSSSANNNTTNNNITITNTTTTTETTTTTTGPPKMHLIVVSNTLVPDIGTSCEVDKNKISREFEIIAHELNMPLKKTMIDGKAFSFGRVDSAFNALKPNPNDVVVFFYSGHGFRWSNQESKYPVMALYYSRYESPSTSNSLRLDQAYYKVIEKGARLNIIIGDCCNSDIGVTERGGGTSLSSRDNVQGKIDRLRTLFLKSKGNLLISASGVNETACGSSQAGGYFINSFFSSLSKETSYLGENIPNWKNITTSAISKASYKTSNLNGCSQQNGIYYSTIK